MPPTILPPVSPVLLAGRIGAPLAGEHPTSMIPTTAELAADETRMRLGE